MDQWVTTISKLCSTTIVTLIYTSCNVWYPCRDDFDDTNIKKDIERRFGYAKHSIKSCDFRHNHVAYVACGDENLHINLIKFGTVWKLRSIGLRFYHTKNFQKMNRKYSIVRYLTRRSDFIQTTAKAGPPTYRQQFTIMNMGGRDYCFFFWFCFLALS